MGESNTRLEKWRANWNAFNSKTGKNEGTISSVLHQPLWELSFLHAFYLVRVVRVADICFAWLVYVRTYCVPIATLNQNERSRLHYFGDAQLKKRM